MLLEAFHTLGSTLNSYASIRMSSMKREPKRNTTIKNQATRAFMLVKLVVESRTQAGKLKRSEHISPHSILPSHPFYISSQTVKKGVTIRPTSLVVKKVAGQK